MHLILHDRLPVHWSTAGAGIAAVTLVLLFVSNRRLGTASSFEDLCSFVLPFPYFQRKGVVSGRSWRLPAFRSWRWRR